MKAPIPESEEQLIVDYIYLDFLIRALEEVLLCLLEASHLRFQKYMSPR